MSLRKELRLAVAMIAVTSCSDLRTAPTSTTATTNAFRLEAVTAMTLGGTVGESVTPVPVVRVTDVEGRPMANVAVFFELGGGGTIARSSTQTDADGSATVGTWTLGSVVGASTVNARTGNLPTVAFTASAEHGPVALLRLVSGNGQMAAAGTILSRPLRVRVTDRFGNAIGESSVSFAVTSGDGRIGGGTVPSDASGFATSGAWTLGGAAGAQHVHAESEGARAEFTAYACEDSCSSAQLLYVLDGEIHTINLLDGDSRLLIANPNRADGRPTWSPDGQQIAFDRDMTQAGEPLESRSELYLANADGSNVRRRAVGFHSPAWSPDGRWLAVTVNDCIYRCEMFLLSVADDSPPHYIASEAAHPAWSPDGTKIAFVSLSGDDGHHELRVMNADGSGVTSITTRDEAALHRPSWSPDGRRIAFSKCARGACSIYTVNSDGSALAPLTTVGSSFGPAWSSDGTRIAFTLWGAGVVYVRSDGGGDPISIIPSGHSPAWRP